MKANPCKVLTILFLLILAGCRLTSSDDGSVPEAGSPEIDVLWNGISIPSGTGSKAFGGVVLNSSKDLVFTIRNTGTGALSLGGTPIVALGGTDAAQFSVKTQPAATVAAGGSATFTLSFRPTSAGSKSATVTIRNNDENEGTYTFTVTGVSGTAGALDTSFGDGGHVFSAMDGSGGNPYSVVTQADGRILVVGDFASGSNQKSFIARFWP